jgi:hypothetical protein
MRSICIRMLVGVVSAASLVACGGGGKKTTAPERTLSSLSIGADRATPRGVSAQFVATGLYSDGASEECTAEAAWESSNPAVATVAADGRATPLAQGATIVRATYAGKTAQALLTVTAAELRTLAVTGAAASTPLGLDVQFTATGTFSDASEADVTQDVAWEALVPGTLDASGVASVLETGLATTLAQGTVTVRATLGAVSGSAELAVTAPELVSIAITPGQASTPIGAGAQFRAVGTYTDDSTADVAVTWSAVEPGTETPSTVATIAADGLATPEAIGTATIRATTGAFSATADLTVTLATLASVRVVPETPSVALGTTAQFRAMGTFSDATEHEVAAAWTALDPDAGGASSVATISATGLATTLQMGTAKVVATVVTGTGTLSGDTRLTVTAPTLRSVTLDQYSVKGGGSRTGTVSLTGPAPAATIVQLGDDSDYLTVPASVTVETGQSSASFAVETSPTTTNQHVVITATLDAATVAAPSINVRK